MRNANKKGEWFAYYPKYFNTVEINGTFYRLQLWLNMEQERSDNGFQVSWKNSVSYDADTFSKKHKKHAVHI